MNKETLYRVEIRKQQLMALLESGNIAELNIYPEMIVQDAFEKNGIHYPALVYSPCFTYIDATGNKFVEDIDAQNLGHQILQTMFEYCYIHLSIRFI